MLEVFVSKSSITPFIIPNWVFRILQETTESGFPGLFDNVFQNNLIILEHDLTEVNVGPDTDPQSFIIQNNFLVQ